MSRLANRHPPRIAQALADQWGGIVESKVKEGAI